ncbi:phosphatidate cytidylyltransferase [Oceanispirochaeta crateris]|uniref:Phosphatidate cytidylyltransferase n=1 Tax=Oceanispirochaeta crateris TaxID=2518645 RepID=A0A5C1QLW0_9SPIO|nr:phosphatidate cytidylyltransferase [Oceanispirochaeta crateris]
MLQSYRTIGSKRLFLETIQKEFVRKSIHLMIALVPTLAAWNYKLTVSLLIVGILVYTYAEYLRGRGQRVPIISDLTALASRDRDKGHFVLGPVTLGIGALSALLLYPHPAASIAIYALAFGDGLSSLSGKLFGGVQIPLTGGKTLAGSLTCFISVLTAGLFISQQPLSILLVALMATFLEALPSKDLDNIIIPMGTGLTASLIAF